MQIAVRPAECLHQLPVFVDQQAGRHPLIEQRIVRADQLVIGLSRATCAPKPVVGRPSARVADQLQPHLRGRRMSRRLR